MASLVVLAKRYLSAIFSTSSADTLQQDKSSTMLTDSAVIDDEINKLFSRVPHHLHGSLVKRILNQYKSRTKPHLLAIPAEIRNAIFKQALVQSRSVQINSRPTRVPGLLGVCKQIRDETIKSFYTLNTFEVQLYSYNVYAVMPALGVWHRYNAPLGNVNEARAPRHITNIDIVHTGRADWNNFVDWCKLIHAKSVIRYGKPILPGTSTERMMLTCLHDLVDDEQSRPWCEVEKTVQKFRDFLIGENPDWER
ncbi:hypothetical protein LTR37_001418 [Vermiconidia calcicola]|uniref:Uncharacterized protein n=1 Tax=Vermiconidia calcicola TaxID=1690605 RepID=A0ACC3NVT8_9PEZI|nr:hypothetical protein LTR37_001418 [Vermiconidia calcicola]